MFDLVPVTAFFLQNGEPMVNSETIAEIFEKEHFHVLRDIDKLFTEYAAAPEISAHPELDGGETEESRYIKDNIQIVEYIELNNLGLPVTRRKYNLTESGFNLIALGFTGKKAFKYKVALLKKYDLLRKCKDITPEKLDMLSKFYNTSKTAQSFIWAITEAQEKGDATLCKMVGVDNLREIYNSNRVERQAHRVKTFVAELGLSTEIEVAILAEL